MQFLDHSILGQEISQDLQQTKIYSQGYETIKTVAKPYIEQSYKNKTSLGLLETNIMVLRSIIHPTGSMMTSLRYRISLL